jgi:triosephosphate isomerase
MSTPSNSRRPLVIANWKMNKTVADTVSFIDAFKAEVAGNTHVDSAVCPPFIALAAAAEKLKGTSIGLGAQNINENENGAFTGEISGSMLQSLGCAYAIIGHSERRQFYGDTDALVQKKIAKAYKYAMTPVVCVGESLAQRETGKTFDVVGTQVKAALDQLPSADVQKLVFAYEPIWAIGTGRTASPAQAQEVHLAIRNILKDLYGSNTSLRVRILYGGSVKPDNTAELMACEDVDGGLVGGASLDASSFAKIVNAASVDTAKK